MTSSALTPPETAFWQPLLTLDLKSDDFTSLAKRLLSDHRDRKLEVPRFAEEEGLKLIELLEPTILQHPDIPNDLKSTAFTLLRRLCGIFGEIPRSCSINEDFKMQEEIPLATRGYTDLWKRDWKGGKVAVKALRFGPDDDKSKITKRFCKEVVLWKRLKHPNILPFCGASVKPNQFYMVSKWMGNGNILSYTIKNPEANRLRLLIDVARGLKFLHRAASVHGNIRGSNILISDDQPPRALLGDFGLNATISDPFSLTRASINWTAPELLSPDDTVHQPSKLSDIYALGMVIYEVLTGTPPFARGAKREQAFKVVHEDERPQRPRDSEKLGLTDEVWTVLQGCWGKVPTTRPSVDIVSVSLKHAAETWVADVPAFMLASEAGIEEVMNMREDRAKDFANKLDEALDRIGIRQHSGKRYLKYLQKLCGVSGFFPASFMLTDGFDDIEARPFTSGGFADVYRATYKGQPVVAKVPKSSVGDLENEHKRFAKEVVAWKWLRHDNILPFVGIASNPPPFSMVSAWMENGDIVSFIRANPDQNPLSLLLDVTSGLKYLHLHDVVHGDLKGANILINSQGRACLADFGLAAITEETSSAEGPNNHGAGGTIRWMAPEILDPHKYGYVGRARRKLPSKSTDMYALGMTILEVITGRKPFENTSRDDLIVGKVLNGDRPDRPAVGFSDALWTLLTQTWVEEFESSDAQSARPNVADVLERLQGEEKSWTATSWQSDPQVPVKPPAISTASSMEVSGFLDNLVGDTGGDPHDVAPGSHKVDFADTPKTLSCFVGVEATDDDWSTMDAESSSRHRSPSPQALQGLPPAKKKRGVQKAWSESKKLFMKTFRRRQGPLKLSDKLVPERDEPKWCGTLFSKPQKSAATGK